MYDGACDVCYVACRWMSVAETQEQPCWRQWEIGEIRSVPSPQLQDRKAGYIFAYTRTYQSRRGDCDRLRVLTLLDCARSLKICSM